MKLLPPPELIDFCILTALADGPGHAYGLQETVGGDSRGAFFLPYSTVRQALVRLARHELIRVSSQDQGAGPQRINYELTDHGRRRLRANAQTLERLSVMARQRLGRLA
jgi:DNA-binding PadR family transcriptional regulator